MLNAGFYFRLLDTGYSNGFYNMALDEALLESVKLGESPPTLRFYRFKPPAISIGYHQSLKTIDWVRGSKLEIDLVRRPTGGRAIYHDQDLTYSLVFPESRLSFSGSILESYYKIGLAFLRGLRALGIDAELVKGGSKLNHSLSQGKSPLCFAFQSRYEIVVNGKKIIGSAQVRREGIVLQQGSLLIDLDRVRFLDLFPSSQEEGKKFITLREVMGKEVSVEEVKRVLLQGFEEEFKIKFLVQELTEKEEERIEEGIKKFSSWTWNARI